ncbi:HET-domain-containing protein [Apiospora sp. TS-2023a]
MYTTSSQRTPMNDVLPPLSAWLQLEGQPSSKRLPDGVEALPADRSRIVLLYAAMAEAQQEFVSDDPEVGQEHSEDGPIRDESCDEDMTSSESRDETTTDEGSSAVQNSQKREILDQLRNRFGIEDPCQNLQGIHIDDSRKLWWDIDFEDWSCDCQFCDPLLPKVLEIAERERPGEDVKSIHVFGKSLQPINISQDPSSLDCFNLARHWLKDCQENHELCKLSFAMDLPKRFLTISKGLVQPKIRLVTNSGLQGRYVALSHCWGKLDFLRLTTDTLDGFGKNISWRFLPKTFQDAIKVCLEMGLSSIWIDSLCILQDSREDWEDQSACMAQIYRNATIVIAANSASGAHEGFLGIRKGLFTDCIIPPSLESSGLYARPRFRHYDIEYNASDETLEKRGWTYQERLLARRYLSFNKRELHWECESAWHCECGESEWRDNGLHEFSLRQLYTAELSNAEIYQIWRNKVVMRYAGRLLTEESDRLPALSAVTQAFQRKLGDTYLAGLWKGDIINGLCWYKSEVNADIMSNNAPSWSWCSIPAQTRYRGSLSMTTHFSHPLRAECMLAGKNEFGEVEKGYVTLCGPLVEAFVKLKVTQNQTQVLRVWVASAGTFSLEGLTMVTTFWPDCRLGIEPQGTLDGKARGSVVRMRRQDASQDVQQNTLHRAEGIGRVWYLLIGEREENPGSNQLTPYALVLGTSPENPERFVRLGVSFMDEEDGDHHGLFANAITTDVTIE